MNTQQQKPTIQKLLDDNSQLILLIIDLQSKGKQNECHEYQRTLYRNLNYLTQFDPSTSHHSNNLPAPDAFIQSTINGNISQTDLNYRTSPIQSQQRSSYIQPGKVSSNTNSTDTSYSIPQNNYGQYSTYHPQQNYLMQQQWQSQSRVTTQQQYTSSSYQQQIPPQT